MARKRGKRSFGGGSVYQRDGGSWRIRWREGGRRRDASGFPTRELAEQVLSKILSDVAAGRVGLPRDPNGVPRLAELAKDWLERRQHTHRAASDDRSRWNCHLKPVFGGMRPAEVDVAAIRRFVEAKLGKLSSTTVGHCVRLLSTFFTDLVERGLVPANPVRAVPRATRRLYRNAHDPKDTGFLERTEDIRRLFLALPEPINVAFAVGALAGLRTGEVLGITWESIDLDTRRIMVRQQVQNGKLTGLKDDESRVVPLGDSLFPVLRDYRLRTGGTGLLFRAAGRGGRPGRPATFLGSHQLWKKLREAMMACSLPPLSWYSVTRHTFASHFVMGGGSIERLRVIMGHESVTTTERYSHLSPSHYGPRELSAISVDMSPATGRVIALPSGPSAGALGRSLGAAEIDDEAKLAVNT